MKKTYVGVRVETIKNKADYKKRLKHNTRYKKTKNVTNNQGYINEYGKIIKSIGSDYSLQLVKQADKQYKKIVKSIKKLNDNFRERKHSALAEAVLYFSEGINEDFKKDPQGFGKRLKSFIKDFETHYDTEVFNFQIHLDEAGNLHIHFIFQNYDKKTGKSLNFTRSKIIGSSLQSLAGKHFKDFGRGYERGEPKDKPRKHLSIEEYKEYKEIQKENEKLKEENERLKEELKSLREEYDSYINEIIDRLEELGKVEDSQKFLKLVERYVKNENKDRLEKLLNKWKKKVIKKDTNTITV